MADITMCKDEECGRKDRCYRYTAKPNEYRQSYCESRSAWNSSCTHEPYKCKN